MFTVDTQDIAEYEHDIKVTALFQEWMSHIGASNFSCVNTDDLHNDIIYDLECEFDGGLDVYMMVTGFKNIVVKSLATLKEDLAAEWDCYLDLRLGR